MKLRTCAIAGLLAVGIAGSVFGSGDFDQAGGRASHQALATTVGVPPNPPSTFTAAGVTGGNDNSMWAAIGPGRNLWTLFGDSGLERLYRYTFSIDAAGVGAFTPQWNTAVQVPAGPLGPMVRGTVAVDANSRAYTVTGKEFGMKFESFTSAGVRRALAGTPSGSWLIERPFIYGVALAEPSGSSAKIGWSEAGTVIPLADYKARVWDLNGASIATYPNTPPPPNTLEVFLGTGHPFIGPKWNGSTWLTERYMYFPGTFQQVNTTTWLVSFQEERIMRYDLDTGGWTTFYSAPVGNLLFAGSVDDASGSATRGEVFIWQKSAGAFAILRLANPGGALVWSAAADPAEPTANGPRIEPPAVGVDWVYARATGTPGRIRMLNKTTGAATDYLAVTFGNIGPITVARDATNDYLVFKDTLASTLWCRKVVAGVPGTHFSAGATLGFSGVPVGTANKAGGLTRPVMFAWTQLMGGIGAPKAFYSP